MLKMKPSNKKNQMLNFYKSYYKPKQNIIGLESAREIFMKEDKKMIVKSCFERIYKMLECKSYTKFEDTPENKCIEGSQ